jgi:hypothetical protein
MNRTALVAGLALLTCLTPAVRAQLGDEWVQYKPQRKIHLVDHSRDGQKDQQNVWDWAAHRAVGSPKPCATYDYYPATDAEVFKLLDERSNRAEIRLINEYGTGSRQFEGYVTFNKPLDDECLFQTGAATKARRS